MPPRALHAAVDQQDGRNPALWAVNTAPEIARQEALRVVGRRYHILVEAREQAQRTGCRKIARLPRIIREHPAPNTLDVNGGYFVAERRDPLARRSYTAAHPPARQIVVGSRAVRRQKSPRHGGHRRLRI